MKEFSDLINSIIFTHSTNSKINLIVEYLKKTQLPDKGYAIAVLTDNLKFSKIKNNLVRKQIKEYVDPNLFDMSYDYVGDFAETISLIWQKKEDKKIIKINDLVNELDNNDPFKNNFIIRTLNALDQNQRWAFIKIILGGLRIGVSSSLVKKALAQFSNKPLEEIEKVWNGISPPYTDLFLWLEGKIDKLQIDESKIFHSLMLAYPLNIEKELPDINANEFLAEYKWDGIRVQICIKKGVFKLYSRSGEDITHSFPEINVEEDQHTVLDGELLVGNNFQALPFNDLQKRLNKKKPSKELIKQFPAFIKVYDILFHKDNDIRKRDLLFRKKKLIEWYKKNEHKDFDISNIITFDSQKQLEHVYKQSSKIANVEGLMIKRKKSLYLSGRTKGNWYKWKKNPNYIDTILMYAQRGHGKRSSYYSDYTLGVWVKKNIIPISKAYSGYTNKELEKIDTFIRKNTIASYGPVKEVKKSLVIEIAFDSINKSTRHKSGLSLRFPRVSKIRWDKPAVEAATLDDILKEFF